MSQATAALEAAVGHFLAVRPAAGEAPTARQRVEGDRAFATILKLLAPRVRHFVRQYGLLAHWDDAEQCCAIAAFRALETYDPEKSQFTTHVNWQIRGELQSLRFRVMTDQRPSAKKVEATTVSLHAPARSADGEPASLETLIMDEDAEELTLSAAGDYVANRAIGRLIDAYTRRVRSLALDEVRRQIPKRELARLRRENPCAPAHLAGLSSGQVEQIDREVERDRALVLARLFGEADEAQAIAPDINSDRLRRLGRRATRIMLEIIEQQPGFALMRDHLAEGAVDDSQPVAVPTPAEPQRRCA